MKTFCQKCGSGTEYDSVKPKFCSNCGNSYIPSSIPNPKTSVSRHTNTYSDDDEYRGASNAVGDSDWSDVDFSDLRIDGRGNQPLKMTDILGSQNDQNNLHIPRSHISLRDLQNKVKTKAKLDE